MAKKRSAVRKEEGMGLALEARFVRQLPELELIKGTEDDVAHQADNMPATGVIVIGTLLAIFQALDGLFTSIGVSRYGVEVEGNPLLRHLMEEFGAIEALTIVKLVAIGIVVILTFLARKVTWIKGAMGAITCIYLLAAIIPWTYILFIKPYLT